MTTSPLEFATAQQVWERLRTDVKPLGRSARALAESHRSVLALDARTGADFPPFDRSVMDGFAVRAADFTAPSVILPCVGLSRAGQPLPATLPNRSCAQINTGAVIPDGADAVVMVEHARWSEGPARDSGAGSAIGRVELSGPVTAGQNIERRGVICRAGATVVSACTRIGAGELAALAAGGIVTVQIYESPRIALLTTGDELVDPPRSPAGDTPQPIGQIIDSNRLLMSTAAREAGAQIECVDRCLDEPNSLSDQLRRGMQSDVLVVAGGMSKGSHDLVPATLERLGVTWLVTSLNLKPGKPTRIGRAPAGGWVVGLPGNPVSCGVCFHLFVRPILDGLQGLPVGAPRALAAELLAPLKAAGPRPMYHPARWTISDEGRACVAPLTWRGSGDPFGLAGANALLMRDSNDPARSAGEMVRVLPLSAAR